MDDQPTQCPRHSLAGSRCTLQANHKGTHSKTYDNGHTFTWTDQSQIDLAGKLGT